jgi:hypothetical protein
MGTCHKQFKHEPNLQKISICVIGTGLSGLSALEAFSTHVRNDSFPWWREYEICIIYRTTDVCIQMYIAAPRGGNRTRVLYLGRNHSS